MNKPSIWQCISEQDLWMISRWLYQYPRIYYFRYFLTSLTVWSYSGLGWVSQMWTFGISAERFLQSRCPSSHQINSIYVPNHSLGGKRVTRCVYSSGFNNVDCITSITRSLCRRVSTDGASRMKADWRSMMFSVWWRWSSAAVSATSSFISRSLTAPAFTDFCTTTYIRCAYSPQRHSKTQHDAIPV